MINYQEERIERIRAGLAEARTSTKPLDTTLMIIDMQWMLDLLTQTDSSPSIIAKPIIEPRVWVGAPLVTKHWSWNWEQRGRWIFMGMSPLNPNDIFVPPGAPQPKQPPGPPDTLKSCKTVDWRCETVDWRWRR